MTCGDVARIIGAKKNRLQLGLDGENFWERIPNPEMVEVFMSVDAVKEIVKKIREYDLSTRKKEYEIDFFNDPGRGGFCLIF